jgi:hypothetical protein
MPWSIAPRWAAARSGTVVGIPSYIILSCIVVFAVAAARLVPSIAFHGDWASVIFNSALRPDVLDHSKTPSADFVSRLPIGSYATTISGQDRNLLRSKGVETAHRSRPGCPTSP